MDKLTFVVVNKDNYQDYLDTLVQFELNFDEDHRRFGNPIFDQYKPVLDEKTTRENFIKNILDTDPKKLPYHCCYLIINQDKKILGSFWLYIHKHLDEKAFNMRLSWFYIDRPYRGQGIGKTLFKELPKHIKLKYPAITTMTLNVKTNNTRALNLYTKSGFEPDSLLMVKKL